LRGLQANELVNNPQMQKLITGGKKLIIVQLSGGNDGLNTIIPFRNDIYYSLRPKLSIEESKIIKLNDEIGLNPEMGKLKEIFDKGNLSIINSVGYPNPDRSHFRSMDIWQSGSGSDKYLNTGWIGRFLDSECSTCRNPYSAIEVDSLLTLAMKGQKKSGIALEDPKRFYMNSSERFFQEIAKRNKHDHEDTNVGYLYKTLIETTSSADYVYENSRIYKSKLDYPNSQFGKNLKTIAEMIISNIDTTVYYVSMSGFDTHVNQAGRQDRLLNELSEGLYSLTEDLRSNNRLDEVMIMTFSEFGRRVKENGSGGTDHGTANNILLIGGNLNSPGLYNSMPDLSNLEDGDLKYEIDFRDIYATLLNKWLDADDRLVLGDKFNYLNFV
ncbi:MAG: DUF1501 domain-containing protein, partial [Bacteroidota bacterium]|nr:DUF1501 domain-containing protein [Bacteroidota bacterium]